MASLATILFYFLTFGRYLPFSVSFRHAVVPASTTFRPFHSRSLSSSRLRSNREKHGDPLEDGDAGTWEPFSFGNLPSFQPNGEALLHSFEFPINNSCDSEGEDHGYLSTTTSSTSSTSITTSLVKDSSSSSWLSVPSVLSCLGAGSGILIFLPSSVSAAMPASLGDTFNPDNFRPVCGTSDSFYRFLQSTTQAVVGDEQFVEYGPLIAGGLLRIRLELCVVESFFNEAVGPFIQQNGLSWILPWHESVETFVAGTIFALATTFILVGSTKIVSVIVTYGDVFLGLPCRALGGFAFDRARGKPVTLDVGVGPFKTRLIGPPKDKKDGKGRGGTEEDEGWEDVFQSLEGIEAKVVPLVLLSGLVKGLGETSKVFRDIAEALDLFIGRYLVLIATGYIALKFVHFKVFPDFPPF